MTVCQIILLLLGTLKDTLPPSPTPYSSPLDQFLAMRLPAFLPACPLTSHVVRSSNVDCQLQYQMDQKNTCEMR